MAKFHVNDMGEAGRCRAKADNCPFARDEDHYSSPEEARVAYENSMSQETYQTAVKRAEQALPERILENLTLEEKARHYMALKKAGVEYIPWRGQEAQLEAAYKPFEKVTLEENWERQGHLDNDEYETLRGSLHRMDDFRGGPSINWGESRKEADRAAFVRYWAATADQTITNGVPNAFVKLPEVKPMPEPKKPLTERIFKR